jgi:hypothetical protein
MIIAKAVLMQMPLLKLKKIVIEISSLERKVDMGLMIIVMLQFMIFFFVL